MPVYKIKDYKIINEEIVKKTKEEYYRETCKGKKVWYFQVYYDDINGNRKKYKSGKFSTKDEADKAEVKFKANLLNPQSNSNKSTITLYQIYYDYCFLDESIVNKESTLYTTESKVRKHVLPFFKDKNNNYLDIYDITPDKMKAWKAWLNKKNLALITKQHIFNCFSAIMTYGKEKYNLKVNPITFVENFRERKDFIAESEEIRYLTNEQYNIFINNVKDKDFKVLFHFLYETGCRRGEMQARIWEDIDFENEKLRINTTLSNKNINGGKKITTTKNGKIRVLDLSHNLTNELKELYNTMSKLDGFSNKWFIFGGIQSISSSTLDRRRKETFQLVKENTGIELPKITNHEFRHSSASYMISNGIPIEIIAYRLGDTVETVRRVYAHLFPDTQKDAKNLFQNL